MKQAIMGLYYKDRKLALKKAEEKNKLWRRKTFVVCAFSNGYMVISKRQMKELGWN